MIKQHTVNFQATTSAQEIKQTKKQANQSNMREQDLFNLKLKEKKKLIKIINETIKVMIIIRAIKIGSNSETRHIQKMKK